MSTEPTLGECDLLIHGLDDDVMLSWALIELGIRKNPPTDPGPPSADDIATAFDIFERLVSAEFIRIGRIEYKEPSTPLNSIAPVRHVEEPLDVVRARVEAACSKAQEWEGSCWIVNTETGDALARAALARRGT